VRLLCGVARARRSPAPPVAAPAVSRLFVALSPVPHPCPPRTLVQPRPRWPCSTRPRLLDCATPYLVRLRGRTSPIPLTWTGTGGSGHRSTVSDGGKGKGKTSDTRARLFDRALCPRHSARSRSQARAGGTVTWRHCRSRAAVDLAGGEDGASAAAAPHLTPS